MAVHKYRVGQTVEIPPSRLDHRVISGAYTIQRLLPLEGRDPQYRVKNTKDGHERVVDERQLAESRFDKH